jgi:D-glycero-alpha-D-manno-heptose 1-phosphate guanylyltransferase
MILQEAVILAGGLGTRLRTVVNELPKVMAPVNGKPFLHYIIRHLGNKGITRIVLSTGYLREPIIQWCENRYTGIQISFAVEEEPLGTGGGIANALQKCEHRDVLVLNGDTFFDSDFDSLIRVYESNVAECVLSLKAMKDFDRYGTVETDNNNLITGFNEKRYCSEGLINAGVYLINRNRFLERQWPLKFSFEKDYLEAVVSEGVLYGSTSPGYFIDIGIPEDYFRCQEDFKELFPSA